MQIFNCKENLNYLHKRIIYFIIVVVGDKMKKMNNKGFTLVELLAVLVILIAIMSIAIPSISSSLERSKDKQNTARKQNIEAAAELYITDHKNQIYTKLENDVKNSCIIELNVLTDNNYLDSKELEDADGAMFPGKIKYTKSGSIEYVENPPETNDCI